MSSSKQESQVEEEGLTECQEPASASATEGGAPASVAESGASSSAHKENREISTRLAEKWGYNPIMPDVKILHNLINVAFFEKRLSSVDVKFSRKLLSSIAYTGFNEETRRYEITISYPIMRLRPISELVQVLLHEAIHVHVMAFEDKDQIEDDHGIFFQSHQHRINTIAGTDIDQYHDFHQNDINRNIRYMRCDGPCSTWPPYFGVVRYSIDEPDRLEEDDEHRKKCGGIFIKQNTEFRQKEQHDKGEVACFICKKMFSKSIISDHFDVCVRSCIETSEKEFLSPENEKNIINSKSLEELSEDIYPCPHCQDQLNLEEMCRHLSSVFDPKSQGTDDIKKQ